MLSPIKRLCHWGPIASTAITASITVSTISTNTNLFWIFIFQMTMCLTLYNMWCATLIGPGSITIDGSTTNNTSRESPDSGRFCRRCCQIVLRKHHHCPWINNCVGQYNESYFVKFLIFAIAVTLQSTTHLIIDILKRNMIMFFSIFNIGLSVGVLIAVSVLLYTH